MLLGVTLLRVDFGPMAVHERNAIAGDLFTTIGRPYEGNEEEIQKENAHVLDLVLPVVVLISSCIIAMIYTGGFFDGASFRCVGRSRARRRSDARLYLHLLYDA